MITCGTPGGAGVEVAVGGGTGVGVSEAVGTVVGVLVPVGTTVAVLVGSGVAVLVGTGVGVLVGSAVGVFVGNGVGVGVKRVLVKGGRLFGGVPLPEQSAAWSTMTVTGCVLSAVYPGGGDVSCTVYVPAGRIDQHAVPSAPVVAPSVVVPDFSENVAPASGWPVASVLRTLTAPNTTGVVRRG